MKPWKNAFAWAVVVCGVLLAGNVPATDVDPAGTDDCTRTDNYLDHGDAPEDPALAYPGVLGRFPTCTAPFGGRGDQSVATGCPAPGTPPGSRTGWVAHDHPTTGPRYWLGCPTGPVPSGIDAEANGKTSSAGPGPSACGGIPTDCTEAAFGLTFAQDECFGDNDAGLAATSMIVFPTCTLFSLSINTYNCSATPLANVRLNILVDWNEDGDWNDTFTCPTGCVSEWAVVNAAVTLPPGCATITSPAFLTGPFPGRHGWMRVTISDSPGAPTNFPWNGSDPARLRNGETEDYPVMTEGAADPCQISYVDFGDAPEGVAAYPSGATGFFPTCGTFFGGAGTQEVEPGCSPLSTAPGTPGSVRHTATLADPVHFWLGCGSPPGPGGADGDGDGKVNLVGAGSSSACATPVMTDCAETAFTPPTTFGQDECYGDVVDAGINAPVLLAACDAGGAVTYTATNCSQSPVDLVLNVLIDWNEDGDWNDVLACGATCAPEWVVKNITVTLGPGCNTLTSPSFQVGPRPGFGWLRIVLCQVSVPDDFPWAGSFALQGGETEDYPVVIRDLAGIGDGEAPPQELSLTVHPNPSHGGTNVRLALPRSAEVSLAAYDVTGRKLKTLVGETLPSGEHSVAWDFRDAQGVEVPVGIYLVKASVGGQVITRSVIRIR